MMVVNKRRDRRDIVAEILHHAKRGRIKTHIMYKARLSYYQINEYLPLLVERGFVENTTIKRKRKSFSMYKTTKEGIELLNRLEFANKLWESRELCETE